MVDEQHAFQMVHLVLETRRHQAVHFRIMRNAIGIEPGRPDPRRAIDIGIEFGNRKTAFVIDRQIVGRPGDDRVDEHLRIADPFDRFRRFLAFGLGCIGVGGTLQIDDEDAVRHADLDRRQPDPRRIVHGLQHVGDQCAVRISDGVDGPGNNAQPRIGCFDDVENGHGGDLGTGAGKIKRARAAQLSSPPRRRG